MKPKDLLEHLEKGDRTMHHLTKKQPGTSSPTWRFALNDAYQQAIANAQNQQIQTARNPYWQVASAGTVTIRNGGLSRW